jgi:plastocyanin
MKKINLWLVTLWALLVLSSCGSTSTPTTTTTDSGTPTTTTTTPLPSKYDANKVEITNYKFNPSVITIKKWDTVTWVNNDTVPHIVKWSNFEWPSQAKWESFSYTYSEVGTFDYICSIHPTMKWQVIVK